MDSLVLITWSIRLLTWLARYYGKDTPYWGYVASVYIRKYGYALCNVVHMIAVWLMVNITALRYVAVCHPLKMRVLRSVKVAWIQFGILVLVSWIFNVPKFFEVDIVTLEDGRIKTVNALLQRGSPYHMYYRNLAFYIVMLGAPIVLLTFTTALIRQLRKSKMKVKVGTETQSSTATTNAALTTSNKATSQKSNQKDPKKDAKRDCSVTVSLVVVDVVFLICQSFHPIQKVAEHFLPKERTVCGTPFFYYNSMLYLGLFFNSSINFVIFCLCTQGFRKKVLAYSCKRNQAVQPAI